MLSLYLQCHQVRIVGIVIVFISLAPCISSATPHVLKLYSADSGTYLTSRCTTTTSPSCDFARQLQHCRDHKSRTQLSWTGLPQAYSSKIPSNWAFLVPIVHGIVAPNISVRVLLSVVQLLFLRFQRLSNTGRTPGVCPPSLFEPPICSQSDSTNEEAQSHTIGNMALLQGAQRVVQEFEFGSDSLKKATNEFLKEMGMFFQCVGSLSLIPYRRRAW
jgi:hypothetical protein